MAGNEFELMPDLGNRMDFKRDLRLKEDLISVNFDKVDASTIVNHCQPISLTGKTGSIRPLRALSTCQLTFLYKVETERLGST